MRFRLWRQYMSKRLLSLFVFSFLSTSVAFAQVEVNGTLDFGISSGGSESQFIANGIPNEFRYLHFSIPQANLLLFAPINETFFFEGRLQADTYGTGQLSWPRFTLANITYSDPAKNYSLSAGRFISNFGFYPSRNLTIDRTFLELPLSYSYYISMSDVYGYWDNARYQNGYSAEDGIMTTVYFGGYSTGLRWDWEIEESKLLLQTSFTSVSPGSGRDYTNLANAALTSRLVYNPNIKWQFGLSASHGSFMQLVESENGAVRGNNPFEQYRQTLVGFDFKYGLGFWEIVGETIYSNWKVPAWITPTGWVFEGTGNDLKTFNFSNIGANIDIKFEPPALSGSYFAFRFDHLNFIEEHPVENNQYGTDDWDKDKFRYSAAFGYKLARNVEGKLLVSEQTPNDGSLYTFRAVITAFF
ncbi:MAG: hypothetical protein RLN81_09125 [Balneolaceae bacterium]